MTEEKAEELVGYLADGVIEGLKFAPEKADKFLEIISERVKNADWKSEPNPLKIVHSAVNCGVVISGETATDKDDKVFARADEFLDNIEAGGNFFTAMVSAIAKRVKK